VTVANYEATPNHIAIMVNATPDEPTGDAMNEPVTEAAGTVAGPGDKSTESADLAWSLDTEETPTHDHRWRGPVTSAALITLLCLIVAVVTWFSITFYHQNDSRPTASAPSSSAVPAPKSAPPPPPVTVTAAPPPAAPTAASPSASTPTVATPLLNGLYRFDFDNPAAVPDWWRFYSACAVDGCTATGVELDGTTHTHSELTVEWVFTGGVWRLTHQFGEVGECTVTVETLKPQPDGKFYGSSTDDVSKCPPGYTAQVMSFVATKVSDAP